MRHPLLAVALLALPAAAAAQGNDAALVTRATSFADVPAGARVRLHMQDSTVLMGRARPVGWPGIVEGRLVSIAPRDARVHFGRGYTFDVPSTAVRRLEARVGEGRCGSSARRRATCRALVLAGAVGVGALAGQAVGRTATLDAGDEPASRWTVGGAVGFGALAAIMLPRIGRDDWALVHDWARGGT